jgi:hypothetical protein
MTWFLAETWWLAETSMNTKTGRCKATNLELDPVMAAHVEASRLLAMVQQYPPVINNQGRSLTVTDDDIRCSLW